MKFRKITTGYVIQIYDTKKQGFISQEFVAGEVDWEDANGEPVCSDEAPDEVINDYLPFTMEQPQWD